MKYMDRRDVIFDGILIIAVGAQVYFFVDELTDGRFSRELSVKLVKTRAKIGEIIEREKTMRKYTGRVIWNAWGAIDHNIEDAPGNRGENREESSEG